MDSFTVAAARDACTVKFPANSVYIIKGTRELHILDSVIYVIHRTIF